MAEAKETPTSKPKAEKPAPSEPDQVAAVSYDVDGNPAQSPGFKVIGE